MLTLITLRHNDSPEQFVVRSVEFICIVFCSLKIIKTGCALADTYIYPANMLASIHARLTYYLELFYILQTSVYFV